MEERERENLPRSMSCSNGCNRERENLPRLMAWSNGYKRGGENLPSAMAYSNGHNRERENLPRSMACSNGYKIKRENLPRAIACSCGCKSEREREREKVKGIHAVCMLCWLWKENDEFYIFLLADHSILRWEITDKKDIIQFFFHTVLFNMNNF